MVFADAGVQVVTTPLRSGLTEAQIATMMVEKTRDYLTGPKS
jgi:hypothetical protein